MDPAWYVSVFDSIDNIVFINAETSSLRHTVWSNADSVMTEDFLLWLDRLPR